MKNKTLYIPFAKILKEFKKSPQVGYGAGIFLCHRSETFKKLWETQHHSIKIIASEFIREIGETAFNEFGEALNIIGCDKSSVLFHHPKGTSKNNQLKTDFLLWGREKNKLSRKKRLQKI